MWQAQIEPLADGRSLQFSLQHNQAPAKYLAVLNGWQTDASFRSFFNELLANCPFDAFRWETPPVTITTIEQPFTFVLLDRPQLARPADRHAFAQHFHR